MSVRILLIAKEGEDRNRYLAAIEGLGVEVTAVSSFRKLDKDAAAKSYHGVMVDLHTKIRALRESKDFVYGILGQFPLVQLKIDSKTGHIRAFHHRQQQGDTLEDFIRRECVSFPPRKFRFHKRKNVHLSALLCRSPAPDSTESEKTATLNLSMGGCFVFTITHWRDGQNCWIVFPDLRNRTPIRCEIRHVVNWGAHLRLPGIGVEFMEICADQKAEIEERFLH